MNSVANITSVISVFLLLISLVQPAARRLRLPYTVLLAVVGIAVGGVSAFLLYTPLTSLFDDIVAPIVNLPVSSSIFLVVFLPLLLFHAALTIDAREIARDAAPILTLAILAVFAAAAAIGFALSLAGVPLLIALLLGAIVATTDPAAVVAIFHELGAPPRLIRLLEGESLLNDAAAIVLFGVLIEKLTSGVDADLGSAAWHFAGAFLGGIALGAVAGRLFGAMLPVLGGLRSAETTLSVALPYIVYLISDEVLSVSGVVAVASAGLFGGAVARVRLRPANWRYLERVWDQTGFWANSLIFMLAADLVPRLLASIRPRDFWLLPLAVVAALASRAAVLFGVMPLLSALRLSERISGAYKLAITWGGLRGAVTLALALTVTENPAIDPAAKELVAVLATGFVLFTLLVNGLSLRPVIRLLKLDRLSPLNQAIRNKILALSISEVRDRVAQTASEYRVAADAAWNIAEYYDQLIGELEPAGSLAAVSDADRLRIGLVALGNRERQLILEHHEQHTVSGTAIERLVRHANAIVEAARANGEAGYDIASRAALAFPRPFRIAHLLHRTFGIDGPLQREISIRFEVLLAGRLAIEDLAVFARERLSALLGKQTATAIADVVARRAAATGRSLDALRLQYPEHAEGLETRFLYQAGAQLLSARYRNLFEEGLIGGELLDALEREHARRFAATRPPPLDLGLETEDLIASFDMFAGLEPAERKSLARLFRPRLLLPDEVVIRKGDRGYGMFFISSGAVEVVLPNERVRLGSGEFFGEMALLSRRPRQADVVSLGYSRVLELRAADFLRFLEQYPHATAEIERVAALRAGAAERTAAS